LIYIECIVHALAMSIESILNLISGLVWGPVMLTLLLGVGVFLTIGLRFMPWRYLPKAFGQLWRGRHAEEGSGQITPFQALMTSLSATIGTGNIAGVATAIALGGPGAVFWMWVTAAFGMATKYSEAMLAVHYRETDELGQQVGGPMYYIKNGLGKSWAWLGFLFALFGMFAAFGIGNTIQSNSVAHAAHDSFGIDAQITGIVMAALAGLVILGGIRRIAEVAQFLVPFMGIAYVLGALTIILLNVDGLPAVVSLIVSDAFTGTAATGGFAGAAVWAAIRFGVARGVFSNEAGLGSAPIAHAAAKTNDPVKQGTIGMLGTFIDTLIICSMTAFVILLSGNWTTGETGAALSSGAFASLLPGGDWIVSIGLMIFAFTTILGWSYYGERCAEFLLGTRIIFPYRLLWIVAIFFGAIAAGENQHIKLLWLAADTFNGLMALPNLIALALLSPVVFRLTRDWFKKLDD
jgi:AGCS family alanine or glycine:cation symporter